jgi:hypothetical protein
MQHGITRVSRINRGPFASPVERCVRVFIVGGPKLAARSESGIERGAGDLRHDTAESRRDGPSGNRRQQL